MMPASLLDPDYQFGSSPLPGAASGTPTDLLGQPLQVQGTPPATGPDQGTALGQTYQMITDAIARQREQSRQMGLLGDDGLPTGAGLVDAARQYAQGVMMGTTSPGDVPPPGITAYHGSPHSFDQFDTSKIGTGEGAQAYGHGLYFAGNEGVARSYRDALAGPPPNSGVQVNGVPAEDAGLSPSAIALAKMHLDGFSTLDDLRASNEVSLQRAQDALQRMPNSSVGIANRDMANRTLDALDELKGRDLSFQQPKSPGSMYQVNIGADPEHFLDWDKPLSEQHPAVQQAVKGQEGLHPNMSGDVTGQSIVDTLQNYHGNSAEAAQALQQAGIPGIRYLDQGSRGAGQGTHNYVVFDADTIAILRKYGIAGLIAGSGAAAATQRQSNSQ